MTTSAIGLVELNAVSEAAIRGAGPRYTPALDSAAPNLEIKSTLQAFDGLATDDESRSVLVTLAKKVQDAWARAPKQARRAFRGRLNGPDRIGQLLREIAETDPASWSAGRQQLERATRYAVGRTGETLDAMHDERSAREGDDDARRSLDSEIGYCHQLLRAIREVGAFIEGPAYAAMERNAILLLGTWGTGKTHFLCDLTRLRMEAGKPTLLVLAQQLAADMDPRDAIVETLDFQVDFHDLLVRLQELGHDCGERSFLLVDGINEGNRPGWRAVVRALAREVSSFSHVGLALSCRTPFDAQIFSKSDRQLYVEVEHPGFREIEIDAQQEFFGHHGIPVPQFPLITAEFSNPLFLKILCEAIADLSRRSKARSLRQVASGQRGMTHVLEHFARRIGRPIEDRFGLAPMTCWRILKGVCQPDGSWSGIAPAMAVAEPRDYVSMAECLTAIREISGLSAARSRTLLRRMVTDGLLAEGLHWNEEGETHEEVVRFPYQRFSDHIIARHLIERHLDTTSEQAIRRSLYVNRPLGSIFELTSGGYHFKMPGLAGAIMLEFPERVKRVLPEEERELVFYLPRARRRLAPLKDVFLDGLYWRSAESFTEQTNHVINLFLSEYNDYTTRETLDILLGLASRPGHPYSALRLWRYLRSFQTADRDLVWSEYLRNADEGSVAHRLLEWVERQGSGLTEDETATNVLRLLTLVLTTTDRRLRDRATRGMVLIGLQKPDALFRLVADSLDFTDPYVPERVLAASYGVAMNLWADPDGRAARAALPGFARSLVDLMFVPGARHATRHVLMRDYALGVIDLARRMAPGCVASKKVRYLKVPFDQIPSPFSPPTAISDQDVSSVERALHMDFNNYTLGRLTPGRRNYQANHPEYQRVRRQILGRMRNLGYSSARFDSIDRWIGEYAWRGRDDGGKTDRYGKKYSWIAYFEMYGLRQDAGLLAEWRTAHGRTSDCDLDPSFPVNPLSWTPELPAPLGNEEDDPLQWLGNGPTPSYDGLFCRETVDGIHGPWVLLDGFIEQGNDGPRQVFTFLRGLFTHAGNVDRIQHLYEGHDPDRNTEVPGPGEDYYTYAGEIPWSPLFGPPLRGHGNAALRNLQPASERFVDGRWVQGPRVEVPTHRFVWESYHSSLNEVSGITVPAPAVCKLLGLHNRCRTFELFDSRGRQATVYREFKAARTHESHLLYLRRDLLERYLAATRQVMVWVRHGERMLWPLEMLPQATRHAVERHYRVFGGAATY